MDYHAITLDTSIFDRYHCRLDSGLLGTLDQFNGAAVRLILSDIVIKEIEVHIARDIHSAINQIIKANKDIKKVGLDKLEGFDGFSQLINSVDPEQVAKYKVASFIERTGAEVIGLDGGIDVGSVFDRYFSNQPPFSVNSKKKNEFPDAFALETVKKWASDNDRDVLVVSSDKDWENFSENCPSMIFCDDLAKALSLVQPMNAAGNYLLMVRAAFLEGDSSELVDQIIEDVSFAVHVGSYEAYAESYFLFEEEYIDLEIIDIRLNEEDFVPVKIDESGVTFEAWFDIKSRASCSFNFMMKDPVDKDVVSLGSEIFTVDFDFQVAASIYVGCDLTSKDLDFSLVTVDVISAPNVIDFGEIEPSFP